MYRELLRQNEIWWHLARKYLLLFCAAVVLLLPSWASAAAPILVEGAMGCETDLLIENLDEPKEQFIGGWRFVSGEFNGIPVVVSVTSVGMTNAAAATVLGIEYFHPIAVINQGTSGGHDPSLHAFDIVLGAKTIDASAWVSHQKKRGADGRHIELRPSYYYDSVSKEHKETIELTPDPELLDVALAEGKFYQAGRVVSGTIASSNNWNRQIERILFMNKQFGTSCEEMETHAAAQVCQNYGVPFLGIRILSNAELHNENFNPDTGISCQQYVLAVIKSYAKRKEISNS